MHKPRQYHPLFVFLHLTWQIVTGTIVRRPNLSTHLPIHSIFPIFTDLSTLFSNFPSFHLSLFNVFNYFSLCHTKKGPHTLKPGHMSSLPVLKQHKTPSLVRLVCNDQDRAEQGAHYCSAGQNMTIQEISTSSNLSSICWRIRVNNSNVLWN